MDRMVKAKVDPGTKVRIFIYEFSKHNNEPSKPLDYPECGQQAQKHLTQDNLQSK